jgi:hypothetical protein
MLRSYALAPETIRRLLRRSFWRFQVIAAISFVGFGLYLALRPGPVDWNSAGPMVALIAVVYFAIIFYQFRLQLRTLYNERYELDDSSITYRQGKQRPMHISRADIARALERSDGISIEISGSHASLLIPRGLAREGDADFRATLGTWVTVQPVAGIDQPPWHRRFEVWAWGAVVVVALLVMFLFENLWLVAGLGVLVIAFAFVTDRQPGWSRRSALTQRLTDLVSENPNRIRVMNMAVGFLVFVILVKFCLISFTLLAQAAR